MPLFTSVLVIVMLACLKLLKGLCHEIFHLTSDLFSSEDFSWAFVSYLKSVYKCGFKFGKIFEAHYMMYPFPLGL